MAVANFNEEHINAKHFIMYKWQSRKPVLLQLQIAIVKRLKP